MLISGQKTRKSWFLKTGRCSEELKKQKININKMKKGCFCELWIGPFLMGGPHRHKGRIFRWGQRPCSAEVIVEGYFSYKLDVMTRNYPEGLNLVCIVWARNLFLESFFFLSYTHIFIYSRYEKKTFWQKRFQDYIAESNWNTKSTN